jgi:hypothetical protein
MRTTLDIADDVLRAARQIAQSQGITLGEAVSLLARKALSREKPSADRNGIKLLPINPNAQGATLDEVNALRDELP